MHKNLAEWAKAYINYRDAVHKKNLKLEVQGDKIVISKRTGEEEIYLVHDDLNSLKIKIKDEKVVCLNTKSNLEWLIKNWDAVKTSRTVFIFANIKLSQSWAVHPSLHDVVTEKSALKSGLKSLFESVPEAK